MTLAQKQDNWLQRIFTLSVSQGLLPASETLPDLPTVADVRRLRRILPEVWGKLSDVDRRGIYEVVGQKRISAISPLELLATAPKVASAITALVRREGFEGLTTHLNSVDVEYKALQQDILSLWENENPEFQARLETAVLASQTARGLEVKTRQDVRAALDELF